MKPHFPAICRSANGTYFTTNHLYCSDEDAAKDNGRIFVRLAREVPPINLVPLQPIQAPAPAQAKPNVWQGPPPTQQSFKKI